MIENVTKQCWIKANKIPAFLWGRNNIKVAQTDDLEFPARVKTDIADVEVYRANIIEIIILKYVSILFLIYVSFNINTYYVSMIGLATASVLYTLFYFTYSKFGKQGLYIVMLPFPILYLTASFSYFELATEFNFGFIFNYTIQYLASFWLLEKVYRDILKGGSKNYYKVKDRWFRYVIVKSDISEFENYEKQDMPGVAKLIMFLTLFVFLFFGAVFGASQVRDKIVIREAVTEYVKNLNEYGRDKKLLLDKEAELVGMEKYHNKIQGIQGYERIQVTNDTELLNIDTNETIVTKGKEIVFPAYIKDGYWHIVENNHTFRILTTKAK